VKHATVAVQAIRDVLSYTRARGVDTGRLAHDAGIDLRQLEDDDARLSGISLGRLWDLAAERSADPFFGLRLGAMATAGGLGLLGYTMLSSANLGAALDQLVRYGHLYTFGIDFDVLRGGGVLRIECRVVSHVDNYLLVSPRHPLECIMAAVRAVTNSLVGRPVPLRSVALGHSDPGLGYDEYQRLLGSRPIFDAGEYVMELDGGSADWPIATANREMLGFLDARAAELLRELSSGNTTTDAVMRTIVLLLHDEAPKLRVVARRLAMSPRALQRALHDEGSTFVDLLEQTRRALAMRYLADTHAVIFEVALLLGFSEPSAFHRAFKRWTGYTPRQFQGLCRSEALGGPDDGRR
jgi:AraC-like DNA-binding protein